MERDAEKTWVQALLTVVPDQPFVGAAEAPRAGEAADGLIASAVSVGNGFAHDVALAQEAPEVVVGHDAAGHAVGVTHNRYGHGPRIGSRTHSGTPIRFAPKATAISPLNDPLGTDVPFTFTPDQSSGAFAVYAYVVAEKRLLERDRRLRIRPSYALPKRPGPENPLIGQ
ncbi:MAG: hypothetical protein OXL34_17800 [Gemmatimonadota bacterium]|nr:hypothetical protein [Gemmatimonadota bacterium]